MRWGAAVLGWWGGSMRVDWSCCSLADPLTFPSPPCRPTGNFLKLHGAMRPLGALSGQTGGGLTTSHKSGGGSEDGGGREASVKPA